MNLGREGVLTGSFGGSDRSGGHHRVGIGVVLVGRGGYVSQSGLAWDHFSVHFTWVGHSFRGYLWASHRDTFP